MSILVQNPPGASPAWTALEKVCHRISFLRASGQPAEAERIFQTDFSVAAAAVRASAESAPEVENMIQGLLQAEERRAEEARELATLLAPLLARHLQEAHIEPGPRRPAARVAPAAGRPALHAPPRGIADFIDEMIAQDHPA